MKNTGFFFSMMIFFLFFSGNKKIMIENNRSTFNSIKMDLKIIDQKINGNKKSLVFIFSNPFLTTDSTIYISYPCYSANVNLRLFKDGIEQKKQKVIRISEDCQKNKMAIKPNNQVELELNYLLNYFFIIDDIGKYDLEVSYFGIIQLKDGRIIKNNQSAILKSISW